MDDLDQGATADVESNEPEVSMEDTIRDTLRDLGERDAVEGVAPQEESTAPVTAEKAASTETPAEPIPDANPLPNTWKKDAADAWSKADPILRAEVQRREADIHKGIEQYKQAADFAQTIDQAIAPYKQTIQSLGLAPQDAIRELMAADHRLRHGNKQEKEMYFSQLAKNYGIDLGQVQQTVESTDPRLYDLAQQNQLLQQQIQSQQQAVQQQSEQALNSEIASFAADPSHVHFEQVKLHMAALLQAEQAKDLSDAYEQAIYANPTTRAAVLQQQAQAAREEATRKAQAAKSASNVNLRSRPAMPITQAAGTMDDTIRDALHRLQIAN